MSDRTSDGNTLVQFSGLRQMGKETAVSVAGWSVKSWSCDD